MAKDSVIFEEIGEFAVIKLGAADEKVAILNAARIDSLSDALDKVSKEGKYKGLVITGNRGNQFCAGADVNIIRDVNDAGTGEKFAKRGQDVFAQVEELKIPSIAAIGGACVGGGFELALACTYRIAANVKSVKIGLPEIKLGIIPGFGGTQRLPRLIGVRPALDIILKGKVLPARIAARKGMVDMLVDFENPRASDENIERKVLETAIAVLKGEVKISANVPPISERILMSFPPFRNYARSTALKVVKKETRGKYPAPCLAVETVFRGLNNGQKAGYQAEAESIGKLVTSNVSKALIHVYFLTEDSSKLGKGLRSEVDSLPVAVFGGGTMGAGIAATALGAGSKVVVVEPSDAARRKAAYSIEKVINDRRSLSSREKEDCLSRLVVTKDIAKIKDSRVVIEAIIEDIEVKKALFKSIAEIVADDVILASNTSSLSVGDIAKVVSSPERVVGLHFFNPANRMPLVEVVMGEKSSDRTVALTAAFASFIGKYPVIVKDTPGFLVNRIFAPYLVETSYLITAGYPFEVIDKSMRSFGFPMGPVRLLDEVGLDIAAKVSHIMESNFGKRMKGPRLLDDLVRNKLYGRKSGYGFYVYGDKEITVNPDAVNLISRSVASQKHGIDTNILQDRLLLPMVNEAVRLFDEAVAGHPGRQAAGQVDLASVMGMGFPPFYGGLFRYAEKRGLAKIVERLNELTGKYGERFKPVDGLVQRAKDKSSLYDA